MIKTFLALAVFAPFAFGQDASRTPNLSGVWEVHFDSANVPPASLTAAVAAEDPKVQAKHDMDAIRWCHYFGVPYVMTGSAIGIAQSLNGKEVLVTSTVRSPGRHIYTDGRAHVNPEVFDPVSNGHSIGHWEGDTLIVDTIGFSTEGITRMPGGGRRTSDSHLVERFRLLDQGKRLSVVSTWTDAKVFQKPHTYEYQYYRAPKGTELREEECNAADETRGKYLLGEPGSASK